MWKLLILLSEILVIRAVSDRLPDSRINRAPESNGCTRFETRYAEAGAQVIAAPTAPGKTGEVPTTIPGSVDVSDYAFRTDLQS